jgi:hypothetical protein
MYRVELGKSLRRLRLWLLGFRVGCGHTMLSLPSDNEAGEQRVPILLTSLGSEQTVSGVVAWRNGRRFMPHASSCSRFDSIEIAMIVASVALVMLVSVMF